MSLLAAALTGLAAALLAGWATGSVRSAPSARARSPRAAARQQWLVQAGLDLTPAQFWLASAFAGAVAFVLLLLLTGVWTVAVPPAVLVALLPRTYFERVRARKMTDIQRAWPDGLRDLVASITSGMSLPRAIEQLSVTGPEPLRLAFARFPFLSRAIGVVPALEVVEEELADPTSDRVIEVLILAHRRGGAIVPDILRDLADATTRDAWTLEQIQTESLEQRINARAVFVLPWLVLVALTLQDGAFREFYASPSGLVVVTIGAVLSGVGMLVVGRLGREPDEVRVLGGERGEP